MFFFKNFINGKFVTLNFGFGGFFMCFVTHPPHSLKDSNVSLKMKTTKEGIEVRSLAYNILKVEGCVGAPGWGLEQVTSRLIIHTNLHNPNNKLISA